MLIIVSSYVHIFVGVDSIKGNASFWTCLQDIQEGMEVSNYQHEYSNPSYIIQILKNNVFMFPIRTWSFECGGMVSSSHGQDQISVASRSLFCYCWIAQIYFC